ncbi:hypothetical protein B0H17DRAFT_1247688 [Mycena rosella]|uniref:Uncharacterized protein n=1 Tax=Mycena rosella TaxID=1033263 RepID=A0AAD7DVT5_MYCRO|nr:hypothetical protein B0H17DRAFT_1247688 [Mycena rosella]
MANILSHRGVKAWLQDPQDEGNRLTLGTPAIVEGNQITTIIEVEKPQGFYLNWRMSGNTPSMNAWCEILRPAEESDCTQIVRVSSESMSTTDLQTRVLSTRGHLEVPHARHAWLMVPEYKEGGYSGLPEEICRRDESNPQHLVYETVTDLRDEDTIRPYIIFRFEFKPKGKPKSGPSSSGKAKRSILHNKPERLCFESKPTDRHEGIQIQRELSNSRKRRMLNSPAEQEIDNAVVKKHKVNDNNRPQEEIDGAPGVAEHVNEHSGTLGDTNRSLVDLIRDTLEAERRVDANLQAQQILIQIQAEEEKNEMLKKQKAADDEEKEIDAKLLEKLLAHKKRLEEKERLSAANAEKAKDDASLRERLLQWRVLKAYIYSYISGEQGGLLMLNFYGTTSRHNRDNAEDMSDSTANYFEIAALLSRASPNPGRWRVKANRGQMDAKAEMEQLDLELQKQLTHLEKSNEVKHKLLGK